MALDVRFAFRLNVSVIVALVTLNIRFILKKTITSCSLTRVRLWILLSTYEFMTSCNLCWETGEHMIPLGRQNNPWAEETSCQENSTPHLTQNLKALGSWVTSLIKLSPHPYLTNVGLQLHTCFFPTIFWFSTSALMMTRVSSSLFDSFLCFYFTF